MTYYQDGTPPRHFRHELRDTEQDEAVLCSFEDDWPYVHGIWTTVELSEAQR